MEIYLELILRILWVLSCLVSFLLHLSVLIHCFVGFWVVHHILLAFLFVHRKSKVSIHWHLGRNSIILLMNVCDISGHSMWNIGVSYCHSRRDPFGMIDLVFTMFLLFVKDW